MNRISKPIEVEVLCHYGCGNKAKFVNGSGNPMCQDRSNKCPAIKLKNSTGLKKSYSQGRRKPASLRYNELPQQTKDRMAWSRGKFTGTEFVLGGKGNHKAFLIQERGHKCESCKLEVWLDKPITLELEHIDGNNRNNVKSNLLLLCPNCHSFTDTWRGRNINSGRIKVSDKDLLAAYERCNNIRRALLEVGLAAKGGNYARLKKLIEKCLGGGTVYTTDLK